MSNYNVKLEGVALLYHLLKVREMDYKSAVELMIKHKQDMSFLKELQPNNNITLSDERSE